MAWTCRCGAICGVNTSCWRCGWSQDPPVRSDVLIQHDACEPHELLDVTVLQVAGVWGVVNLTPAEIRGVRAGPCVLVGSFPEFCDPVIIDASDSTPPPQPPPTGDLPVPGGQRPRGVRGSAG